MDQLGEAASYVFNSTSLHWTWGRPAAFSLYLQARPLFFFAGSRGPQLAFYFTYFQNSRNFVVLKNALRTSIVRRPKDI